VHSPCCNRDNALASLENTIFDTLYGFFFRFLMISTRAPHLGGYQFVAEPHLTRASTNRADIGRQGNVEIPPLRPAGGAANNASPHGRGKNRVRLQPGARPWTRKRAPKRTCGPDLAGSPCKPGIFDFPHLTARSAGLVVINPRLSRTGRGTSFENFLRHAGA